MAFHSVAFRRLMTAFAEEVGESLERLAFQFDGDMIDADCTPEALDMEDDDCIDARLRQ